MSLEAEALALAAKGYYVLPLAIYTNEDGEEVKKPLTAWKNGGEGEKATNDPDEIRQMPWQDAAAVALATKPSGIVVVDLDPFYWESWGRMVEGDELVDRWQQMLPVGPEDPGFDPPWVSTRSNGAHLYFRAHEGRPISDSVGSLSHKVDVRGAGIIGLYVEADVLPAVDDLPEVPEWLWKWSRKDEANSTPMSDPQDAKYKPGEPGTKWGLSALEGEKSKIRESWEADNGTFNHVLNRAAFAIGQLVAGGELEIGSAYSTLEELLAELGAPQDQHKTLDSGFNAGYDRPRSAENEILEAETTDEERDDLWQDFIDYKALVSLPPPQWLLPGYLVKDSLAQIVGEPGSGKTFVTLDMAACVSRGCTWPDRMERAFRPSLVVYVAAEDPNGLGARTEAWVESFGPPGALKFLPKALQIGRGREWEVFLDLMREHKPSLIVWDTQARVTVGVEENSATEMGMITHRLEQLRLATGACVVLVHHTNKGGSSARGSNVILGAVATEIAISKTAGQKIGVEVRKQKNAPPEPKIYFTLDPVPSTASVILKPWDGPSGSLPTKASLEAETTRMLITQALQERHLGATCAELATELGKNEHTVYKILCKLVEDRKATMTKIMKNSRKVNWFVWTEPPCV